MSIISCPEKLKDIYKQERICDQAIFGENINMATDQNYSFGNMDKYKAKMSQEKIVFHMNLQNVSNYAYNMKRIVEDQKVSYKFKRKETKDFDTNDTTNKTLFINSSVIKRRSDTPNLFYKGMKYNFSKISSLYAKQDTQYVEVLEQNLSLSDIESIGSPTFIENCSHKNNYFEILADLNFQEAKQRQSNSNYKDRDLHDQFAKSYIKIKLSDARKGIRTVQTETLETQDKSYLINYQKQLNALGASSFKPLMPSPLNQQKQFLITKEHILEMIVTNYKPIDLRKHLIEEQNRIKQQKLIDAENQIESQLNQITAKILKLREKKNLKKQIQVKSVHSQKQKMITKVENPKDFLSLQDKHLIEKIESLMKIRAAEIKKGKDCINIHQKLYPLISNYLFELLIVIATGQDYVNWADFMFFDERDQAEKALLELLYNNGIDIEKKYTNSGNNKITLLYFYTSNKTIIEKEKAQFQASSLKKLNPLTRNKKKEIQQKLKNKSVQMNKSLPHIKFPPQTRDINTKFNEIKNLNATTKENTMNFNQTKRSATPESIERKINSLFRSPRHLQKKSTSKSPIRPSLGSKSSLNFRKPDKNSFTPIIKKR